jgi:hypothetical protein
MISGPPSRDAVSRCYVSLLTYITTQKNACSSCWTAITRSLPMFLKFFTSFYLRIVMVKYCTDSSSRWSTDLLKRLNNNNKMLAAELMHVRETSEWNHHGGATVRIIERRIGDKDHHFGRDQPTTDWLTENIWVVTRASRKVRARSLSSASASAVTINVTRCSSRQDWLADQLLVQLVLVLADVEVTRDVDDDDDDVIELPSSRLLYTRSTRGNGMSEIE